MAGDRLHVSGEHTPVRRQRRFDPLMVWGILGTLAIHCGAIASVYAYQNMEPETKSEPDHEYVVAKLVKLGKKKNPRELPKRVVPQPDTKLPETVDLSANANDKPVNKPKPKKRAQTAKTMQNSLDKIAKLADAQRQIDQEGDPQGSSSGTARTKGKGDLYMTRIADIWNRTWSLPSIIARDDAKKLYALVVIRIDASGKIKFPIKFDRGSGNEHFDNSIRAGWARIKKIPVPPPDRLGKVLADGLALKLTWRGLR